MCWTISRISLVSRIQKGRQGRTLALATVKMVMTLTSWVMIDQSVSVWILRCGTSSFVCIQKTPAKQLLSQTQLCSEPMKILSTRTTTISKGKGSFYSLPKPQFSPWSWPTHSRSCGTSWQHTLRRCPSIPITLREAVSSWHISASFHSSSWSSYLSP